MHAIRRNTGGVAEPIQLMTLSKDGNNYKVREADDKELQETRQNVTAAEEHFSKYSMGEAASIDPDSGQQRSIKRDSTPTPVCSELRLFSKEAITRFDRPVDYSRPPPVPTPGASNSVRVPLASYTKR